MYFGVVYHPEQWVYPYGGTADNPEGAWEQDADMMAKAGINVIRMGEHTWGLCEPEEGQYDFTWLRRVMNIMAEREIKVVLATPTAAPPLWLAQKHPEILPVDEQGLVKHEGTRRAVCLNSDVYWEYSKRIVEVMANALGNHPALVAWQIDHDLGGDFTEASFNEDTRRDWHGWLEAKYETIERLNDLMGLRQWGQTVVSWNEVPTPMSAPTMHNPALLLDWHRFCSDTIVQFVKMQAELLRELTPDCPVTTNLGPLIRRFDHFDLAEVLDFVSMESPAVIKAKSAETACEIDMLRSLKKANIRTPDSDTGFWVMAHQAGTVNWQDVHSLARPGLMRLLAYQLVSRGADALLFHRWRQPRFGNDKLLGAVLPHHLRNDNRIYKEVSQIGDEMKMLAPALKGTHVPAEVCILYSHYNDWTLQQPMQPNKFFNLREHIQLIYNALHDRNIAVDFCRPSENLSKYKLVFAPSLHLLSGGDADLLKLYVQNGGTLVGTFNTGLVSEHSLVPTTGFPRDLTDLFGLEVLEFDPLPPGEENHLTFKGTFPATHAHPAKLWCDLIEPKDCQVLATYGKDFYAGQPAMTLHTFGLGKAIYLGTLSHQYFYTDLVTWLRQLCNLQPLLKTPDNIEVSLRQKGDTKIYFLLNHQNTPVRLQFYQPMHDYLTGNIMSGNYDLPPCGVLVLDEQPEPAPPPAPEAS